MSTVRKLLSYRDPPRTFCFHAEVHVLVYITAANNNSALKFNSVYVLLVLVSIIPHHNHITYMYIHTHFPICSWGAHQEVESRRPHHDDDKRQHEWKPRHWLPVPQLWRRGKKHSNIQRSHNNNIILMRRGSSMVTVIEYRRVQSSQWSIRSMKDTL